MRKILEEITRDNGCLINRINNSKNKRTKKRLFLYKKITLFIYFILTQISLKLIRIAYQEISSSYEETYILLKIIK